MQIRQSPNPSRNRSTTTSRSDRRHRFLIHPATPSTLYTGAGNGGVFSIQQVTDQRVLPLHGGRFRLEVDWIRGYADGR